MPQIVSIVYTPASVTEPRPADRYARVPLATAELLEDRGIAGDRKGSRNRQLNLMGAESLAALKKEGFKTAPGELGEQIVLAGVDVDRLPAGAQLRLGEIAIVEVVLPRTGCERFEAIQGHPRKSAAGRLGVMARVVRGGTIRVGDLVQLLRVETEEGTSGA
jgi:MOSC domain-containing protein YiiM